MQGRTKSRLYMFKKSTFNYHVYREVGDDGKPLAEGLPKDTYFMDCRPDIYLPNVIHGKAVGYITITIHDGKEE